jgi:FdhD protein
MGSEYGIAPLRRQTWRRGAWQTSDDSVAREHPLQIRINGIAYAVIMRTPGHDEELARGFLWTERVISDLKAVRSIRHASADGEQGAEHTVQVVLHDGVDLPALTSRRHLVVNSSCGLCGRASIEALLAEMNDLSNDACRVAPRAISEMSSSLRAGQELFAQSGGTHAAGLFHRSGELLVVREDVGRHNALDKVIGWFVDAHAESVPPAVAMVSGRVSAELVQKANRALIPVLVAVSAPSSLAVQLAEKSGMTLVGFARDASFNVYAGAWRLQGESQP